MLIWVRNNLPMKQTFASCLPMRETSRVIDKKLSVNNTMDSSVYDAMVIMAQDFSTREPLFEGHGNFGSMDVRTVGSNSESE